MPLEAALTQLAEAIAAQPLGAYGAGLALVLCAAGVLHLLFAHLRRWQRDTDWPPLVHLALRMGLCFALLALSAELFADLAEAMQADALLGQLDQIISTGVQRSLPAGLMPLIAALTHLGDMLTLVLVATLLVLWLLWRRRYALATAIAMTALGGGLLNVTLKGVFARVRPVHTHGFVQAEGWSFPSGHSSGAVVVYGLLAYVLIRHLPRAWHLPVALASVALAYSIGCSRVFLQVHWPSDVAAGLASGSAWLLLCLASIELLRYYRQTRRGRPASTPAGTGL